MMGHECPHDCEGAALGQAAASVIERLVQAVSAAGAERNEAGKIERSVLRVDHGGERRRIGGYYCVFAQASFEPEARDSEVRILVSELQIPRVVSGFRDAPGDAELSTVLHLSLDDQAVGLAQQAPRRCTHDQRWHQVFEHRARPGDERRTVSYCGNRAPEPKPVAGRYIVFRDGYETCETRFRGEQVVAAGIQRAVGRAVADREESPLGIEQKAKLHRVGHFQRRGLQAGQPLSQSQGGRIRHTAIPLPACDRPSGRFRPKSYLAAHLIAELTGEGPRNVGKRCGQGCYVPG